MREKKQPKLIEKPLWWLPEAVAGGSEQSG